MGVPSVAQIWCMLAGSVIIIAVARILWNHPPPPAWRTLLVVLTAIPFFGFGTGSHVKIDLKSGNVDIASIRSELQKVAASQSELVGKLASFETQISAATTYPNVFLPGNDTSGIHNPYLPQLAEWAKGKGLVVDGEYAKWIKGVLPSEDGNKALLWGYVDKNAIKVPDDSTIADPVANQPKSGN